MRMMLNMALVRLRTPNEVLVAAAAAAIRVRDHECEYDG